MISDPNLYALFLECHRRFKYADGDLVFRIATKNGKGYVGTVAGGLDLKGYRKVGILGREYYAHRIVYLMFHGWIPVQVDHKDLNKSNCHIENLRAATNTQNTYNRPASIKNTSGVKGVYWYKRKRKWHARCDADGKSNHLGYFDSLDDAAFAVRQFREQHHGEFANHGVQP